MQGTTKDEMDMISSVADTGIDEAEESIFLRRSGRLTESRAAPVAEALPPEEDTHQAAITPKPSRRVTAGRKEVKTKTDRKTPAKLQPSIAAPVAEAPPLEEDTHEAAITPKPSRQVTARKRKVKTKTDRKTPAKLQPSIAAEKNDTTRSTGHAIPTAVSPNSSWDAVTKETKVAQSTGRKFPVKRRDPSNAVKSALAIAQQQESVAFGRAVTLPNTDDAAQGSKWHH